MCKIETWQGLAEELKIHRFFSALLVPAAGDGTTVVVVAVVMMVFCRPGVSTFTEDRSTNEAWT